MSFNIDLEQFNSIVTVDVVNGATSMLLEAANNGVEITPELSNAAVTQQIKLSITHLQNLLDGGDCELNELSEKAGSLASKAVRPVSNKETRLPFTLKVLPSDLDQLPQDASVIHGDREAVICLDTAGELENGIEELDFMRAVPSGAHTVTLFC